jgi:hypothetical protein
VSRSCLSHQSTFCSEQPKISSEMKNASQIADRMPKEVAREMPAGLFWQGK